MAAGKEITHEEHIYEEAFEMNETLKPVNTRNKKNPYGCPANVNDTHAGYDNVQLPQPVGLKKHDTFRLKGMTVVMVAITVVLIAVIIFLGIREGTVLNGGWSIWEPWGLCSATCGGGMNRRVRSCYNPTPSNGGNFCFGESSEYRLCNTANCGVIHGGWSLWTSWTSCSSSCTKTRTRSCTNPAPSQGGHMCQGDAEDKDTCILYTCVFCLHVRLAGGSLSSNGRVEVSLDNFNWGTVCDDNFNQSDARVVCRMLGYTSTSAVLTSGKIEDGSGQIYLDDLACSGDESSLLYCHHAGWGKNNCQHTEDVGVSCS